MSSIGQAFVIVFNLMIGESRAQTTDYCQRLFAEATFPSKTSTMATAFSFDPDRGGVVSDAQVKKLNLKRYSSEITHRLESQFGKSGPLKDVKMGFQISNTDTEPREITVVQDFLKNYAPRSKKNAPVMKMHVLKYSFAYRNGVCFPITVTEIDANKETVVFNLDQCAQRNSKESPSMRCESSKVYRDALADPRHRIDKEKAGSAPAGKSSR